MQIRASFSAVIQKNDTKGGWSYVVWPQSTEFFGTKGTVKVRGKIDGKDFEATFMAMGGGVQMLPIKAATRTLLGKDVGDTVFVELEERFS